MPVMQPTAELVDRLRGDKIEQARRMSFAEKFFAGAELFDYACAIATSAIRQQHPEFTDEQVLQELRRRVALGDRV